MDTATVAKIMSLIAIEYHCDNIAITQTVVLLSPSFKGKTLRDS